MGDKYLLSTGILYLSTGQKLLVYVLITKWREKRPGGRGLNIFGNFIVGYKRRERDCARRCAPVIPALRKHREEDRCKFLAILICRVISPPGRATQPKLILRQRKKQMKTPHGHRVLHFRCKLRPGLWTQTKQMLPP